MRGIALVSCPTTLLAQVDASIGGKSALNLPQGKNLIGAFHQPRAVYADVEVLATLSASQYRSGLGEVLKTALIAGPQSLERLEQRATSLAERDLDALEDVVAECVRAKGALVEQDELDANVRKRLNLGHTFAHGLEHALGFGQIPHGVAVACGLGLALACARELDLLGDPDLPSRAARAASMLGLPAHPAELGMSLSADALLSSMRLDKKRSGEEHRLVLPRSAGDIAYDVPVREDFLARFLQRELREAGG
jgi:3-dehydroquinate synthase